MPEIKYDENGGILNADKELDKKEIHTQKRHQKYSFLERALLKYSKKINYLFDDAGRYRCRKQKTPSVIRIGPTNRCTGQCFYCPREYVHDKGTGYMEISLYEKILDFACQNNVDTFSFALYGEPLLHPQIFTMLSSAKQKGLKLRISTNAIIMKKDWAEKLLELNLESIEVSLDGYTQKEYEKGKQVDKFEIAKANILYLLQKAREMGSKTLFNIHYVDIGNVSFINKIRFIRFWKKQLRGLNYLTSFCYEPHNWAGTRNYVKDSMSLFDKMLNSWHLKKPCMYIKGMNINWNGDVCVCANDPTEKVVIGNINTQSFEEIYNNEKRLEYLTAHETGNYGDLNCSVCDVNSIRPLAVIKKRIVNGVVGLFSMK